MSVAATSRRRWSLAPFSRVTKPAASIWSTVRLAVDCSSTASTEISLTVRRRWTCSTDSVRSVAFVNPRCATAALFVRRFDRRLTR